MTVRVCSLSSMIAQRSSRPAIPSQRSHGSLEGSSINCLLRFSRQVDSEDACRVRPGQTSAIGADRCIAWSGGADPCAKMDDEGVPRGHHQPGDSERVPRLSRTAPTHGSGDAPMMLATIPEKGEDQNQEQHRANGRKGLVVGQQLTEILGRDCAGAMAPSRMHSNRNGQADDAQRKGTIHKAVRQQGSPDRSARPQVRVGLNQTKQTGQNRNRCGCHGNHEGNCVESIHVVSCAT